MPVHGELLRTVRYYLSVPTETWDNFADLHLGLGMNKGVLLTATFVQLKLCAT
jgi:hypothetical protein